MRDSGKNWSKELGYNRRWSVESFFSAYKRDRITKIGYWLDWSFYLTDTGGLLDKNFFVFKMKVLSWKVIK